MAKAKATGGPPPAGWYPHPQMPGTQRYWDGAAWTDHVAPQPAGSDAPSTAASGWGYVFAIFLPIVGFFIGLALLSKRGNDGIKIIVLSVVMFIVWFWIISAVRSENAADACESENIYRQGTGLPQLVCR